MPTRLSGVVPLRVLALRAIVGYPLLRMLLLITDAILAALAGGEPVARLDSPAGIVIIAMLIGWIDTRRRGETMFWLNLGYSPATVSAIFGLVALTGEAALAVLRL